MRLFSSRPAGLAAKSFLQHNQATIAQTKVGFLELCASPLGVMIGPNLVILVHEEKAVVESGTLRNGGTSKTRLVPDLETMI
jgi:hypothetical protein